MKALLGVPLLAVALALSAGNSVSAGYFGAASFRACNACCDPCSSCCWQACA